MVLNPHELSLNIKPTYVPRTISEFLGEVSMFRNVSEKLLKLDNFIKRLEEEMRKIDAFKRELPLSVVLINDAIVALKEELIQCRKTNVESVFEESIPLKKSCDEAEKDEVRKEKDSRDKKNWMSSVQLWNNTDDQSTESNYNKKSDSLLKINKKSEQVNGAMTQDLIQSSKSRTEGRAFMPFKGYSTLPVEAARKEDKKEELPVAGLSLLTPGISWPREELGSSVLSSKTSTNKAVSSSSLNVQSSNKRISPQPPPQQQAARKQRRCWSPELHRRFVCALQQLGGSQAATPKQIRDLMHVDGLTNDEVKSHLQKYRLHTRKSPVTSTATPANQSALVLDRLWIPQEKHGGSSKKSHSESSSPEGPLQLTEITGGTCTTWVDGMEDEEDEEGERSESYSWKSRVHTAGKDDV